MDAQSLEFPVGPLRGRMLKNIRSYAFVSISVSSRVLDRREEARMAEWLRKELIRGDQCARDFFIHKSAEREWRQTLSMACAALGYEQGGMSASAELDGILLRASL